MKQIMLILLFLQRLGHFDFMVLAKLIVLLLKLKFELLGNIFRLVGLVFVLNPLQPL